MNWNVDDIKDISLRTDLKCLKRLGIVHQPIFDAILIQNYVVPPLHIGLGLSNNFLDKFDDWLLLRVDKMTVEESKIFNSYYTAEIQYEKQRLKWIRL